MPRNAELSSPIPRFPVGFGFGAWLIETPDREATANCPLDSAADSADEGPGTRPDGWQAARPDASATDRPANRAGKSTTQGPSQNRFAQLFPAHSTSQMQGIASNQAIDSAEDRTEECPEGRPDQRPDGRSAA